MLNERKILNKNNKNYVLFLFSNHKIKVLSHFLFFYLINQSNNNALFEIQQLKKQLFDP